MAQSPVGARLRLVDVESGKFVEGHDDTASLLARIGELEDQVAGAERDLRGWRYRYRELERDKEAEAKESPHWPTALECFDYWQVECRHPRSEWSAERFYLALPFLRRRNHGREKVLMAIAGAAYDPFVYTLKNGRQQRSDGWEKILENVGTFERFVNKCPRDWVCPPLERLEAEPQAQGPASSNG